MSTTCPCPSWCENDTCRLEHSRILRAIPATGGSVFASLSEDGTGTDTVRVPRVSVGLLFNKADGDDAPSVSLDGPPLGAYLRMHEAKALIEELRHAVELVELGDDDE